MLLKQDDISAVDVVIVIGQDRPGEDINKKCLKKFADDCVKNGLSYYILGDGKTSITLDSCETLPSSPTLIIVAHGAVKQHAHFIENNINSLEFIHKAQDKLQCKDVVLCSCYSGKVLDDIQKNNHNKLLEGTFIVASSAQTEVSLTNNGEQLIEHCIAKIKPGTRSGMIEFVGNAIKTIPETLVVGLQLKDEFVSETLLRKTRGLDKVYLNVKRFCEYQTTVFNEFIDKSLQYYKSNDALDRSKDEFQNDAFATLKKSVLTFSMSQEEENAFQERSLVTHVCQNDVDIMDSLLGQNEFDPGLLAFALYHSSVHGFQNLSAMIDLILKHKNNAKYGMNVNAFCPNAKVIDYERNKDYETFVAYTPLTFALQTNQPDSIEVLLKHGADIYLPDSKGTLPATILNNPQYKHLFINPLEKANEICNSINIISVHLPADVDYSKYPSLQNDFNELLKKKEAFEQLCQTENDTDFLQLKTNLPKNSKVYKAYYDFISSASNINPMDIVTFALDNELKNELAELLKANKVFPALNDAVINNNLVLVKANLYVGSNATQPHPGDPTPLCYAVAKEHTEIVIELLKNSAHLKATPFQTKYLAVAASHANPALKNSLIAGGIHANADPNALDELLRHIAKNNMDYTLATPLINWNANINSLDTMGNAALHYCVINGYVDFVLAMYHWKADLNVRDAKGRSALQLASMKSKATETPELERHNYIHIIKILIKGGANFRLDPEALTDLNLSNSFFVGFNFSDSNLSGTDLSGANLERVILTNSNLTGVNFTGVKNLEVEQLIAAKSIRNSTIDSAYLKGLNDNQLAQLINKAVQEYETFIANNTVDSVVTQLLSIINNETHLLKYSIEPSPGYRNTPAYEQVIVFGKERLLTLLKNQNLEGLNIELQEQLKTVFPELMIQRIAAKKPKLAIEIISSFPDEQKLKLLSAANKDDSHRKNVILTLITHDSEYNHGLSNKEHFERVKELFESLTEKSRIDLIKSAATSNGGNLLHSTVAYDFELFKLVLNYLPESEKLNALEATTNNGDTVLHNGARNPDSVKTILELYPSKEEKSQAIMVANKEGMTTLDYTLREGREESCLIILPHLPDDKRAEAEQQLLEISPLFCIKTDNLEHFIQLFNQLDRDDESEFYTKTTDYFKSAASANAFKIINWITENHFNLLTNSKCDMAFETFCKANAANYNNDTFKSILDNYINYSFNAKNWSYLETIISNNPILKDKPRFTDYFQRLDILIQCYEKLTSTHSQETIELKEVLNMIRSQIKKYVAGDNDSDYFIQNAVDSKEQLKELIEGSNKNVDLISILQKIAVKELPKSQNSYSFFAKSTKIMPNQTNTLEKKKDDAVQDNPVVLKGSV